MKLFNLDSPFMQFLTMIGNLMIVNILTILLCIPILTAGDAMTAMYYVTIKMARGDDPYIVKSYFKSFKENFKQATILWLIVLVAAFVLITDCRIIFTSMTGNFATVLKAVIIVVSVIALMTCLYLFPVLSRFENTIKHTIKNAFLMSILNLPRSILIILIHALPVLLVLISANTIPVIFLLGMSTVAYLCSTQYVKIFKKYEPEDETEQQSGDELQPLSFIVEEEKAKMEAIAAAEAAEREAALAEEGEAEQQETVDEEQSEE